MASYTEGLHLSYTLSQLHLVKFYKAAKPLLQLTNIRRHNPHSLDTHSPEARGYTQKTLKNVKKIPRWVCTTASDREQSKLLLRSMLLILNLVCYLTSVLTGVPNKVQTQRLLKKNYILSLTTNKLVYLLSDVLSTCVSLWFLTDICGSEKL